MQHVFALLTAKAFSRGSARDSRCSGGPQPAHGPASRRVSPAPQPAQRLQKFRNDPRCEIRIDSAFATVMQHCAQTPRDGQNGTWIVQSIVDAYTELHQQGAAHSVETWIDGQLVGGLYCVALGRAVFGESMFALQTDASKIALSALVALCRAHQVPQIDCQQATAHLSFMGAREVTRAQFARTVQAQAQLPDMQWQFSPIYWEQLLSHTEA
jgi:leucyl/phenylalanyl-tRNA--protein transferase